VGEERGVKWTSGERGDVGEVVEVGELVSEARPGEVEEVGEAK